MTLTVFQLNAANSKNGEPSSKGVLSGKGWLGKSVDPVGSAATE
jgi:hypothetical protein